LVQTDSYAAAEDYCQEALAIAQAAGDEYLVADLLQIGAWPDGMTGQYPSAPAGPAGSKQVAADSRKNSSSV